MTALPPVSRVLSRRESQVLALIAQGLGDGEIGRELFLSVNTVKSHVRRVLSKLGAGDRTHAVAVAFERGLLPTSADRVLRDLLRDARPLLGAIPRCPWHRAVGVPVGECPECRRFASARRVLEDADALLGGGRRG